MRERNKLIIGAAVLGGTVLIVVGVVGNARKAAEDRLKFRPLPQRGPRPVPPVLVPVPVPVKLPTVATTPISGTPITQPAATIIDKLNSGVITQSEALTQAQQQTQILLSQPSVDPTVANPSLDIYHQVATAIVELPTGFSITLDKTVLTVGTTLRISWSGAPLDATADGFDIDGPLVGPNADMLNPTNYPSGPPLAVGGEYRLMQVDTGRTNNIGEPIYVDRLVFVPKASGSITLVPYPHAPGLADPRSYQYGPHTVNCYIHRGLNVISASAGVDFVPLALFG